MADAVPVCDVLCDATEYLSKLGSNLRVRSENLKEKKIRKDRLKNAHAVQKAAKKVLLICELSKKSLDDVETGVKNLLSQIDLTQCSSGSGGKSRRTSKASVSYEYFEYGSRRLKIREKICIKHYTSVKVVAKPMPPNMLKEYPVYLDCVLYRIQKENGNPEKAVDKDHNFDNLYETQRDIDSIETSKHSDMENNSSKLPCNDNDKNPKMLNECPLKINKDCVHPSISEKEKTIENANSECEKILPLENNKNVKSVSSDQSLEINSICRNKNAVNTNQNKSDDSPNTNTEDKNKGLSDSITFNSSQNNHRSVSKDRESDKCNNSVTSLENTRDNTHHNEGEKNDELSESTETKKSFIKCVNINQLLEAPIKEQDTLSSNKDCTTATMKEQQKSVTMSTKENKKKYKRITKHKSVSDDSSLESDSLLPEAPNKEQDNLTINKVSTTSTLKELLKSATMSTKEKENKYKRITKHKSLSDDLSLESDSQLPEAPNKEQDNLTINKVSTTSTFKEQLKSATMSTKENKKKYKRITNHKSLSDDSSLESDSLLPEAPNKEQDNLTINKDSTTATMEEQQISATLSQKDRQSDKCNSETSLENTTDNTYHKDGEKNNELSESSETKTSFIKCINKNQLLGAPNKEQDNLTINKDTTTETLKEQLKSATMSTKEKKKIYEGITKHKSISDYSSLESDSQSLEALNKEHDNLNINKDSTTTMKEQQLSATISKKEKKKKYKRISNYKSFSDDSSLESDWEQKREAVKLFKPKEFVITIYRLPNFSNNFLKSEGLNRITQNGLTLCALKSCSDNPKELQIAKEKCSEEVVHPSLSITEQIQMNDSDSDKSLNRKTDKDLLDVAESVRNSLLNASDSDREIEFENIGTSAEPASNDKETLRDKKKFNDTETQNDKQILDDKDGNVAIETNTCNEDILNENSKQNRKASSLNSSSDNNDPILHNEMINNTTESKLSLNKDAEVDIPLSLHSSQDPEKVKLSLLHYSSDSSISNVHKKIKIDKEDHKLHEDPAKVKSLLLHDSSDNAQEAPLKQSQESEKETPRKTKRKHIMESMYAKKMLLTYSSSSDTEDEQLRNVLKDIKESLLEEIVADKARQCIKIRPNNSDSDSEKIDAEIVKRKCLKRKASSPRKGLKLTLRIKKRTKSRTNNSDSEEHSNSGSNKMGRSRAKRGSSSNQNSDSQDANDKHIDGLTNLRSLNTVRRRRGSSTDRAAERDSDPTEQEMPRAPRIKAECLLKAETSSDAASLAGSDLGEEAEELPTVSMSTINGDGISHLAKDDLLGDSDSSTSQNDKSQEDSKKSESDEETVKSKRRAKAAAISSDSEAASSRKPSRGRRLSDFEDSEDDGSSERAVKKRRKKKESDSDGSDTGKKKRRRIKNLDESDASDSDTENEGRNKHGRKNIRKVMGKNQLEEATKKAAREEKERIARIAERQKVYNNLEFDESGKPDEVILEKVVLDFDPETKEPLIEVDRGLVKKLKPHQANGIKFMWDACFESVKRIKKDKGSGCILAHCMGLGKTLQVVSLTHTLLTHGDLTSVKRVLVVCPLSTVLNWVNEFRIWLKHSERDYEVDVYELSRFKQNSERAFQLQQWFEYGGVCVLGYEMFRNLSADNTKKFKKKMLKSFQESLVDPGPDLVVCDEGHLLKNEKTSLSQSMNRVKTLRRIVLTGTPLQNNLKEYYCMVQFVKPNLLGKYNEYLNRFVNPITNGQYTDSTEHDIKVMKRRSHVLHKMLDGAVQRRDYGVLAPFLPPKHEYVLFITLTEVQIKLYEHYLENFSRRPLAGKSSGFLFPDFQSLQRIWTHPLVLKYNSERYEIMQQKKRDREEEDSEGSLADFIDDESTPDESSTEESSDDSSDLSDDSRKKSKKKKAAKKGKAKDSKVSTRRGTRANPADQLEEEEEKPLEVLESKYENPTEWWIKLMNDDELDDMRNSHKLVLLFDILRQCETIGDKLLVFSQSLYSLDLIEHFLGKVDEATQEGRIDEKLGRHVGSWSPGIDYFRLDGSTSCENRSIWCKNFNREDNPRARLFLISTRAGGLGINLVAANRVVIFDVSWNPSHDVQSIFRVYRFGQKKPCYVYRFLAMGTMEEKIYERQVTKQAISKRVIDEQQIDRHYAENDLAELYKFEPRPPAPRPLPPLPKDRLFAEMLREHDAQIYKYHEHDSLLENKEEETLSEEERKAAWEDFENEKNRPPPAPFPNAWQMPNGMMPGLLQQQQQLAYATLGAMLRKDMPNITDNQIREMLMYANSPMMQKMNEMYKYPLPGMMNNAAMNSFMNPGGAGADNMSGSSGLQYEPPWLREQKQQQIRMQQAMQQQQQNLGAKFYAGGLGSRDPVAMAIQQQRTREMMLGERARPRGRPPLQRPTPPMGTDVVNLADSD